MHIREFFVEDFARYGFLINKKLVRLRIKGSILLNISLEMGSKFTGNLSDNAYRAVFVEHVAVSGYQIHKKLVGKHI